MCCQILALSRGNPGPSQACEWEGAADLRLPNEEIESRNRRNIDYVVNVRGAMRFSAMRMCWRRNASVQEWFRRKYRNKACFRLESRGLGREWKTGWAVGATPRVVSTCLLDDVRKSRNKVQR